MKKIIKMILLIGILSIVMTYLQKVEAETYNGKIYDVYHPNSGFTVFAAESNGWMDYNSWIIKSAIDDKTYYCIDPSISLGEAPSNSFNYITNPNDIINKSNLTKEKYNKIKLLAYYGYGYKNEDIDHTDKKWYGITQVMIWRVVRPDLSWTFKASRNATPDKNLYKEEVEEINRLVASHNQVASFSDEKVKILIGESITIKDANNVLQNFSMVNNTKYISVQQNKNEITITANKLGIEAINYSFRNGITNPIALLTSPTYQDILVRGKPTDLPYFQIKVEVTGGVINLQKVDDMTNKAIPQGEATLKESVYEVYDSNNNAVGQITTDANGKGNISLDFGKYTIKEIKAPKGYNISNEIYEVELTKDNNEINLQVSDKVVSGKILLTKKKGGSGEDLTTESGAEFNIIDSNGNIINKLTTDNKGVATAVMPYGTYTIRQIKGSNGYILAEDTQIIIDKDKVYEININNLKLSKLILTKIDASTNETLRNTKVEIYTSDDKLIYTGKTDNKGQIKLEDLKIGKYYVIEKEAPKYYRLNEEKIYFEVKENGKVIKLFLKNNKNQGTLVFTKYDSSTNKKLQNCYIQIYDENNKKVFEGKTNKNGKVILENLNAGSYCIYEKTPPKGYVKNKDKICFEIENDKEIIKVEMSNDPIIKVPNTMLMEINTAKILGIIIVSLGISFIIYEKRKEE